MRVFVSFALALLLLTAALGSKPAIAQGDPRGPLLQLIQAFQNCGPPAAYQMLSPQLFQIIRQQTNGSGCYRAIQAAGPVQSAQVVDQRQFPNGTVYAVRVVHAAGAVDWFIGFNQFTSQVEYLSFQPASGSAPSVNTGPSPTASGPGPSTTGNTPPSSNPGNGCDLFPAMC